MPGTEHGAKLPYPIEKKIRTSFSEQGLMETLGAEIVSIGYARCVISAPMSAQTVQQHGAAHAGLTFSIGDSSAGYAALATMAEDAEVMTSEMKIHLLAPARGDRLVAEGRVLRAGRRLVIAEADVFAEVAQSRTLVARLIGTILPVAPRSGR